MEEEKEIVKIEDKEKKVLFDVKKLSNEHLIFCRMFFGCCFILRSIGFLLSQNESLYKVFAMLCLGVILLPKIDNLLSTRIKIKNLNLFKYLFICFLFSLIFCENQSDMFIGFFSSLLFVPGLIFVAFPFFIILKIIIFVKNKIIEIMGKKTLDFGLTIKNNVENIVNNTVDKKTIKKGFIQEHKERDFAVRKKVNEMATKYVEQFVVGNYPRHKIFNEEEISVFKTIIQDSLTELELVHIRNIDLERILQIKYNNQSYDIFRTSFVKDNNLTDIKDFKTLIIAYLNTFDENFDWIYYFLRYVFQENIRVSNSTEMKMVDIKFQLKLNYCCLNCGKVVNYLEQGKYEHIIVQEFIKNFSELSSEIIQKIQFEQKVQNAKFNMETGCKAYGHIVSIEDVDGLDGLSFEHLLGKLFKQMNYNVEVTRGSGDQGADLVISKMGIKTVVQAKCYFNNVSNKAIQEVVGAMAYYDAENGMVVTNSYFTKGAKELAEANNIVLWDRDKLAEKLRIYGVVIE